MNIGFVDDHPFIIQAYKSSLNQYKCTLEAKDGIDLIEKLNNICKSDRNNIPDLMIVDIYMPNFDGFQVVEYLKKNFPNMKIVISTMSTKKTDILRMVKLGIDGFMFKNDLTIDYLIQYIAIVLEKGKYFNEYITELIIKSFQNINLTDEKEILLSLNEKEIMLIKLVSQELTTNEISKQIGLSPRTIESLLNTLYSKLDVKGRIGLGIFAQKNGILN